jgi:hypothetical protein
MKSSLLVLVLVLISTASFAEEGRCHANLGICFVKASTHTFTSTKLGIDVTHNDYEVYADDEFVRSIDITGKCNDDGTCNINPARAQSALTNLAALVKQLKADGICKTVVDNVDNN